MLQRTLGVPLLATKGYADPDVVHTYTRAQELCQQVGDTPEVFPVLWGLVLYHALQGNFQVMQQLGEQCLTLAHRQQDQIPFLVAHLTQGIWSFLVGAFAAAVEHLEQVIVLYDPDQHHDLVSRYGQDLGVVCRIYMAQALWCQGYPDQGLAHMDEALRLARQLSAPFDLVRTLPWAARLHLFRCEAHAAREPRRR